MKQKSTTMRVPAACGCGCGEAVDWPIGAMLKWYRSKRTRNSEMPQNITKSAKDIVKDALSQVTAISAEEAMSLVGSPDHVFVDLRDGIEQAKTGIIAGAVASSRGMLEFHIDPDSPAHKPEFNQDKTYVFYCASGGRSALAATVAMEMGLSPLVNLTGGVGAWKKAGGDLVQE
ncbi:rhodanese-like domain-containing protein [Thalassobium sp. R2A62]|jgi:rhodanese-related sulfurtransferase|uniref:rhodanese-like domain-containing protein n=1 Tax=Thalassobium sp. R2A62 TaxID=633131 RepID=UPI0001B1D092|nr:rhodanese domain protein [Thalassobium sp. R2A62]